MQRVDGDIGERICQPRHAQKCFRAGGRSGTGILPVSCGRGCQIGNTRRDACATTFGVKSFQPEHEAELPDDHHERQVKNALEAEFFDQCAADEERSGVGGRPGDVVNADGMRNMLGRVAFAHQRLNGGPDEAHADVGDAGGHDLARTVCSIRPEASPTAIRPKPNFSALK